MLARLNAYVRGIARRRAISREVEDELRFHLEQEIETHLSRGATPAEARRRALRDLGGLTQTKEAVREVRAIWGSGIVHDSKLGWRMIQKYPGLTLAGGLALAIAVGIGAAWYDFTGELLRPSLRFPDGNRIVEIEMRNPMISRDERRVLHDFLIWKRDGRLIGDLGAYRTVERNLVLGDARAEPVTVAETSASAFRVTHVRPLLGRTLLDEDEQPGARPVIVLGFGVWQQQFGGRPDVIGQTVQLGRTMTTVVGVMPQGFAFPVDHRLWVPLSLRPSGYLPLDGPAVRVFGRLAPNATQAQASAEITALVGRVTAASPQTHAHLRPRVLAYGGESAGDRRFLELAITHLPVLLVLIIACTSVGTLVYARTATREAEIAMRFALGANRGRIVAQLFVEALVLASLAALIGLTAAHWGLKWATAVFYSGGVALQPFWVRPGLKIATVFYASGLTVAIAAILGVLPALRATGSHVQAQVRNLGSRGSTLRLGGVWTIGVVVQVTLTIICLTPAFGITREAVRDRIVRARFPAADYLAVRIELDGDIGPAEQSTSFPAQRKERIYDELERLVRQEPGVLAVTFADRLPGMDPEVRQAEVEAFPGRTPIAVRNLWTSVVGTGFFEAFDKPILAGRGFHGGDLETGARTVIVNEAFARRFTDGATPIGRRLRYATTDSGAPEPWFEIVGMVRDMGMTPTNRGEAPYVFHAASPETVHHAVMGVRVNGDPSALTSRIRAIAAGLDAGLRLDEMRPLDEMAWRVDMPHIAVAGALTGIVGLGLFLSAGSIFSLMSVSIARRSREIGLRAALGASSAQLLTSIFSRPVLLLGTGIAAGNIVLLLLTLSDGELTRSMVIGRMPAMSAVMLMVGLLACVEPARRALRIDPTNALKQA